MRRATNIVYETDGLDVDLPHTLTIGTSKGWRNHPCVKMWRSTCHPDCLAEYGIVTCFEYGKRTGKVHAYQKKLYQLITRTPVLDSSCVNLPNLISSYRSLLLRKDPAHYRRFWPKLSDAIPFVWPDGTVSKS